MKVALFTNEYPPNVYGGAGIHVDYLSRELSRFTDVEIRCFGKQKVDRPRLHVRGYDCPPQSGEFFSGKLHRVYDTLGRCLEFQKNLQTDLVHCHTWYTHFAGLLAKFNYSIPLIVTCHSLEPLRPWKREQLGSGYDFTCWLEKTTIEAADAVIGVSEETKKDIIRLFDVAPEHVHAIHNGVDPQEYQPIEAPEAIRSLGINPDKPYVLFVGRITQQKGIFHLLRAVQHIRPDAQIVIHASAADTEALEERFTNELTKTKITRPNLMWIRGALNLHSKTALYSHASVFCCPSIYEPFGIINVEAMACGIPVVASAVGGIKEVVQDEITGFLVPLEQAQTPPYEAIDPEQFSKDLADKINFLLENPEIAKKMGLMGRKRVLERFTWRSVAEKTYALYESLTINKPISPHVEEWIRNLLGGH